MGLCLVHHPDLRLNMKVTGHIRVRAIAKQSHFISGSQLALRRIISFAIVQSARRSLAHPVFVIILFRLKTFYYLESHRLKVYEYRGASEKPYLATMEKIVRATSTSSSNGMQARQSCGHYCLSLGMSYGRAEKFFSEGALGWVRDLWGTSQS